jgi:ribosomal protein L3 glutamine methyltransferase
VFAEAKAHLVSVRDLLRFAVTRFGEAQLFFGHGFAGAHDEAAYLVAHALHLPHGELEPFLDARLLPDEIAQVLNLLQRRVDERIPAAYLTREAWLGENKFYVDQRVIVPRSFIAELLPSGLAPWIGEPEEIHAVLDLCTGSGCLAILAALAFANAQVDAADISPEALAVARINVDTYELASRIRLIESDLFGSLADIRYDLVVCNPPYVTAESMQTLPAEYRHEPASALAGGADGLDYVRRILDGAPRHLSGRGVLVMETGHNKPAVEQAFPALPFTWVDAAGGADYVCVLRREDFSL